MDNVLINEDARAFFFGLLELGDRECWLWLGTTNNGYGSFYWKGKTYVAHRVMYEYLKEPIIPGHVLHHDCQRKNCVNPRHLVMITPHGHMRLHQRKPELIEKNFFAEIEIYDVTLTRKQQIKSIKKRGKRRWLEYASNLAKRAGRTNG